MSVIFWVACHPLSKSRAQRLTRMLRRAQHDTPFCYDNFTLGPAKLIDRNYGLLLLLKKFFTNSEHSTSRMPPVITVLGWVIFWLSLPKPSLVS